MAGEFISYLQNMGFRPGVGYSPDAEGNPQFAVNRQVEAPKTSTNVSGMPSAMPSATTLPAGPGNPSAASVGAPKGEQPNWAGPDGPHLENTPEKTIQVVQQVSGVPVQDKTIAGQAVSQLADSAVHEQTPLSIAEQYLGKTETKDTAVLASFIKKNAGIDINPANTAWCAAWMNAVLGASGDRGSEGNRLAAKSFATYGEDVLSNPEKGDIAVFTRTGGGHVGFFIGYEEKDGKKYVRVLGGNQGNSVSEKLYPADRLVAIRRIPKFTEVAKSGPGVGKSPSQTSMDEKLADLGGLIHGRS